MKALITGASSGIGKEMAIYLSELGHELILVSNEKEKLEEVRYNLKTKAKIIVIDLSDEDKVKELYMIAKNENIDILINNAGFGVCGGYDEVDLQTEIDMISVNVKAVHILTKLFLKDMEKKGFGYILNVSSLAGFLKGGAKMSCYYATKSYVTSYTLALYQELKNHASRVKVSVLCPGPIKTNFLDRANVKFKLKGLSPRYVAISAIDGMFKNKTIIIPGFKNKLMYFFSKFVPTKLTLKIISNSQDKDKKNAL